MLMTFISGAYISGAHFVINRAWALHHKLGQSELLTDPQLRHPDDSVEGPGAQTIKQKHTMKRKTKLKEKENHQNQSNN